MAEIVTTSDIEDQIRQLLPGWDTLTKTAKNAVVRDMYNRFYANRIAWPNITDFVESYLETVKEYGYQYTNRYPPMWLAIWATLLITLDTGL